MRTFTDSFTERITESRTEPFTVGSGSMEQGSGNEGCNSPIHDRYNKRARDTADDSRPRVLAVMDGCYADEIGAAR